MRPPTRRTRSSPEPGEVRLPIKDIVIGERHRKYLGDVEGLAESIKAVGLLHPVVVTPTRKLIAGERRILAAQTLGWEDIPVHIVDLDNLLQAEADENNVRLDFAPTEAAAVAALLRPIEEAAAKERQRASGGASPGSSKLDEPKNERRSRTKVAKAVGMSATTLEKVEAVVEAAEADPELGAIVARMDATGNVSAAYRAVKDRQRLAEARTAIEALPAASDRFQLVTADFREAFNTLAPASVDAIITDPPYAEEFLSLYGDLARHGARILKPGGSVVVMVGQSYLPAIFALMGEHLTYHWTLAYMTPGASARLWDRRVFTSWKPVLWFVVGNYAGPWIGDVAKSDANDKRFHRWGQFVSGMVDLVERLTQPGDLVLDPFLGAGTTGVAALLMGRRFIGIDNDPEAVTASRARLAEAASGAA